MSFEQCELQVLGNLCGSRIKSKIISLLIKKLIEIMNFKDMYFESGASDGKNRLELFHCLN